MSEIILKSFLWSILPISELRGGILYALTNGVDYKLAYLVCVSANLLAIPIVYLFLGIFHEQFMKIKLYENLFDKFVARTRKKVEKDIEKYGFWGLMVFVMIPLPVTGAYTGTFAAWLFGFKKREAFLAVSLGVLIAGVIVTVVVLSGSGLVSIFTKQVSH